MADIDTLRDRVETLLKDASNEHWTTAELDQAIRMALAELSTLAPARAVTTIDAMDNQREYNLSTISGLQAVVEVWYPYLDSDQSYKQPHPVKWRMLDETTLYLDVEDDPDSQYKIRLFYDKIHTIQGLDGATSTTLNEPEKAAIVLGAAGYAAVAKGRDAIGEIVIGADTPENYRKWGYARLQEFNQKLYTLASIDSAGDDARIGWWTIDKWDGR